MKKSTENSYIISLDLGSTNLKAALFDNSLNRIIEKTMSLEYLKSEKKHMEFDGEKAWGTIKELMIDIVEAGNIGRDHKVTISVCSQANTFSIIGKDGNLKMPFISWLDGRAVDESKILKGLGYLDWLNKTNSESKNEDDLLIDFTNKIEDDCDDDFNNINVNQNNTNTSVIDFDDI